MSGSASRPSIGRGPREGWAGAIPVILVTVALVAGCAVPGPSTSVTRSEGPTAAAAGTPASTPAGSPAATPGATPGAPAGTPGSSGEPAATSLPTATPDAGAWTQGVELPPPAAVATFEATATTAAGVLPDTAFRLAALDGSDPVVLARRLKAEPALTLRVEAGNGTAIVRPTEPLTRGQRYRFTLSAPDGTVQGSWAVQAVEPIAVAGTTPYDGSTGVPIDTGIEVALNQYGVDLAAATPFISLSPAVRGHFEQAGKTIAFLPDDPLARSTLYTLTVRKGLPLAGTPMTLEADVVVRFETTGEKRSGVKVRPMTILSEVRPVERAVITLDVDRYGLDEQGNEVIFPLPKRLSVTVHRLDGIAAAISAWRTILAVPDWTELNGSAPIATGGLPKVLDALLPLRQFTPADDWQAYIQLPTRLDRGWYVVTMTREGMSSQVVVQVTDLAVYTVVTGTRTVAWVNDLRTKGPLEGATATLDGTTLGRTDAQGLVLGRTPANLGGDGAPALVIRAGSQAVFVAGGERLCDKCSDVDGETSGPGAYRLVFQSDRYTYRATDTINAWGVVRSRATGAVPARVEVRLETWNDASATAIEVASRSAQPDRNGAFLVQFPMRELPYGDYVLELVVNGEPASDRSITVAPIEKPAWQMSLMTSRRAVISGARVKATVDARFFEGTPVAGAAIAVEASDFTATLRTDASGTGTASVRLRLGEDTSQWDTVGVNARPTLPEEAEIGSNAYVAVFQASVLVKSDAVVDGGRLVVSGTVHDVALARFERSDDEWLGDVNPYGPTRSGVRVRVQVTETIYERHKTGTQYDWILKRVVPVYETTERTRDLGTQAVRSDAKGRFRVTVPVATKDRSYDVQVRATDAAGRVTTDNVWASLAATTTSEHQPPLIESSAGERQVSVGDTVRLRFRGGSGDGQPAHYLWTTAHAGLGSAAVTTAPRYAVTFRTAYIPVLVVNAVRFNGLAYEVAPWEQRVYYRLEDRALKVDVRPDRERYAPGGRATLAIRTTDAAGQPVNASAYVGVVDEKLVAMGLVDESDPLDALYEGVGSGILGISWTHRDPRGEGGAEGGDTMGGGGDDDAARSDFRDWLVARIVRTGSDGRATVSFDLSDDLTSWHAYVAGVGGSLLAGTGTASLPVSLPFFAELTVAESYLAVDRPIVRVRAYGTALSPDDTVTFKVSSDTLRMAPVAVKARAFEAAEVPLPALSVGTHRIRVEAVTGTGEARRRDALVRTFEVLTSRTAQASVTSAPLAGPTAVAGGKGLTTLVLGDAGRGRVIPVLEDLAAANPIRGESALASGVATRVLRDAFGMEPWGSALDLDLSVFQESGGFAVTGYSTPDLELSAIAAMSGDPRLRGLDEFFAGFEPTTREQRIWVLVGGAATGAPVMAEIRAAAERTDLTLAERVALGDAAVAVGDDDLAGRLLREILRDAGQRQGPWVRVVSNLGDDHGTVLTARLAIVASWLGEAVAADMDAYLAVNRPTTTVIDLERAVAAQGWVDRVPAADAVAALTVDGRRSEIRIDASQPVRVVLTPAQVGTARLEPVSGSVLVTTRTDRPLDPSSLTRPGWLRPVRTVTPRGSIELTDVVIVKITLKPPTSVSHGCLNVTEAVPSGLVPISQTGGWSEDEGEEPPSTVGPWSILGQRVDFCVDPDPDARSVTLRYVARVVTPGRYRWEPTVVQSVLMPEVGTVIPATTITINGIR